MVRHFSDNNAEKLYSSMERVKELKVNGFSMNQLVSCCHTLYYGRLLLTCLILHTVRFYSSGERSTLVSRSGVLLSKYINCWYSLIQLKYIAQNIEWLKYHCQLNYVKLIFPVRPKMITKVSLFFVLSRNVPLFSFQTGSLTKVKIETMKVSFSVSQAKISTF